MEKFKISFPENLKINKEEVFVADHILPISINFVDDNKFIILFCLAQDSTETCNYIQVMMQTDNNNEKIIIGNLVLANIKSNKYPIDSKIIEIYNSAICDINDNGNLYNSDFEMHFNKDNRNYYTSKAAKPNPDGSADILNILIPRDNFIKTSLFFNRLYTKNRAPETVFNDYKLNKMEFIKVKFLKHDASATDLNSNIVFNHYTCECGPNIVYKFNYISQKIPGRTLRNPTTPLIYENFYKDHFIVLDTIYEPDEDVLLVVYEVRSEINDNYKCTKILKFDKQLYNRTNLIDPTKIYE